MDGTISAPGTITGTLSAIGSLNGALSSAACITGEMVIPTYVDVDIYDGDYRVSPNFIGKTLPTANKTLTQDVVVESIRVDSVINLAGGNTVYIGGII